MKQSGDKGSAVAPTNDSQSTPDELRKWADCFDPERMEIAIVLRTAADAWEMDLENLRLYEAERDGVLRERKRLEEAKLLAADLLAYLKDWGEEGWMKAADEDGGTDLFPRLAALAGKE
jgi:hypothetical protein